MKLSRLLKWMVILRFSLPAPLAASSWNSYPSDCEPIQCETSASTELQEIKNLFHNQDYANAIDLVDQLISRLESKAKEMQASLKDFIWESREKIFSYWALNDVALALFINAEALEKLGRIPESQKEYQQLITEYKFAQCFCPEGYMIQTAVIAQQRLETINTQQKSH